MRTRVLLALVAVIALSCVFAGSASALETETLIRPQPDWYTQDVQRAVLDAGPEGVQLAEEELNLWCPGVQDPGVGAGGCIVDPAGCTANFVFTNGTDYFVGTASHCTERNGEPVVMQVDTTTLAEVGVVDRQTAGEDPGEDFALIRLYDEVVQKWGLNTALPMVGGPNGVYDGCGPETVQYYGHGYEVAVAQGKPGGGLANTWYDDGYGWYGTGFGGDSGSGVVVGDKRGAGNLTHLIIFDPQFEYTPGQTVGMRLTAILRWLGGGFQLVNADGSTSSGPATSACGSGGTNALKQPTKPGGGNGKGGGKGGKSPA